MSRGMGEETNMLGWGIVLQLGCQEPIPVDEYV
jgi:hypothetical protein